MKTFIGTTRKDFEPLPGERLYMDKHSWDCDWYWGFGYIGNAHLHTHFESVFLGQEYNVSKIFVRPKYTQKEWWIIRDLFIQAYGLKRAAEIYRHGGHQTSDAFHLPNDGTEAKINRDLKTILDKAWQRINQTETFFEKG